MSLAHKFAVASDFITGDMVSAGEFPHLTNKYHVFGVPKAVINEQIQFEGGRPEAAFVEQVMRVMSLEKDS